ncbi:MAG: hypothetical protein QOF70_6848 [Acetobacteraceae bacterium]|nr:hypothetical protein [Acetobacteraceae bacterium]
MHKPPLRNVDEYLCGSRRKNIVRPSAHTQLLPWVNKFSGTANTFALLLDVVVPGDNDDTFYRSSRVMGANGDAAPVNRFSVSLNTR